MHEATRSAFPAGKERRVARVRKLKTLRSLSPIDSSKEMEYRE